MWFYKPGHKPVIPDFTVRTESVMLTLTLLSAWPFSCAAAQQLSVKANT